MNTLFVLATADPRDPAKQVWVATVTAAAARIVMDFTRAELDAGMPLYPRRGPPLGFGGPLAPANDHSGQLGSAAGIQAMFGRLARGYNRFGSQDETLPQDGGTLT